MPNDELGGWTTMTDVE